MKGIEVFRAIIPASKLINDNSGQHYRIMTGKSKWLTNLTYDNIEGARIIEGFKVPDSDTVNNFLNGGESFSLILEHWKCQRSFDLANYEMTYKSIIDVFSKLGYWKDDAWKYLNPVIFSGGDHSNWHKAIRGENDNLPDNIKKQWWLDNEADPSKDSFIRIIAVPTVNIKIEL